MRVQWARDCASVSTYISLEHADEETLRRAALKTVEDEGYEIDPLNILFS